MEPPLAVVTLPGGTIMRQRQLLRRPRTILAHPARLLVVPIVTGLAVAFALVFGGSQHSVQASTLQGALYSPGGEPGEVSLTKVEQYWQTRLTYPTGRFNQRWALSAVKQAKRIK